MDRAPFLYASELATVPECAGWELFVARARTALITDNAFHVACYLGGNAELIDLDGLDAYGTRLPGISEIARAFGMTPAVVDRALTELVTGRYLMPAVPERGDGFAFALNLAPQWLRRRVA